MAAVAALLDRPAPLTALRRALSRAGLRLVPCRNTDALERMLHQRLIEAIITDPPPLPDALTALLERFPAIPVIASAPFRPADGAVLLDCHRRGMAAVLVEGVDDVVAGELVRKVSWCGKLERALADGPRVLRLREPLQRRVWELLLAGVERPSATAILARRLGVTREHLSRQFGAGGAPNLKRVADLVRVAAAALLLANPGYTRTDAAQILGFSSASHLSATARRVSGLQAAALGAAGPRAVLQGFVKGRMRSRNGGR